MNHQEIYCEHLDDVIRLVDAYLATGFDVIVKNVEEGGYIITCGYSSFSDLDDDIPVWIDENEYDEIIFEHEKEENDE